MTTAEKPRYQARPGTALTPAEQQVIRLVAQGMTNKQIAEKLVVSKRTVDSHVEHIYARLGVHSRAELLIRIREQDIPGQPGDPPLARRLRQFGETCDMTPMERALTFHVADIVRSVALRQAASTNGK